MPPESERNRATLVVRASRGAKWTVSDDAVAPSVGERLGPYQLLNILGEGAGGKVFLAEHTLLGRRVAIKMIHPKFSARPALVRRFFDEARAVTRIGHENIVSITDLVVSEAHPSFYVMELLEGQTLHARLSTGVPLPFLLVLEIGIQLCKALEAAHAKNVVHRDVKPSNIFLQTGSSGGRIKLLDFGVAEFLEGRSNKPASQDQGTLVGTPRYMSPEAVLNEPLDGRADIYALGVVLYEMIAGVTPFDGDSVPAVLEDQVTLEPKSLSETLSPVSVPTEFDALVQECLAKMPIERPQTVKGVRLRLEEIKHQQGTGWAFSTAISSAPPALEPGVFLRRAGTTLLALASVLLVGTFVIRDIPSPALDLDDPSRARAKTPITTAGPMPSPLPVARRSILPIQQGSSQPNATTLTDTPVARPFQGASDKSNPAIGEEANQQPRRKAPRPLRKRERNKRTALGTSAAVEMPAPTTIHRAKTLNPFEESP